MTTPLKVCRSAAFCLALTTLAPAFGQDAHDPARAPSEAPAPTLTLFDLDFPGGTAGELVDAIQRASGRPLNAVIPVQDAKIEFPPLKMRQVTTRDLFRAMAEASRSNVTQGTPGFNGIAYQTTFGFRTGDERRVGDNSVWYFFTDVPTQFESPRTVNFFLLTPYLDQGLSVDDVTTAINTGWKMLGDSTRCELSYHKETKLLIVVADRDHTETVIKALEALRQARPNPTIAPPTNKPPAAPAPGQ